MKPRTETVKEIESPSGLDLHPAPPSSVRLSKRAGILVLVVVFAVAALVGYGIVTRSNRSFQTGFHPDDAKGLTAATDAGKVIAAEIPNRAGIAGGTADRQPDPRFGNMVLEQFGGANGELAAAMQYSVQGLNCDDPERKDLLMDIWTEELSHLEVVGTLARMHLKPLKMDRTAAQADPMTAIAGGGGVNLFNSMGDPWTADYLKITGELDVDLRSNIAAEARAKIVYERLINFTDDPDTIDALQFLMTREITHMMAFTAALESLGKPALSIGRIPPTPGLVNQYFNDSTGTGDRGEQDARGPWNEGGDWELVTAPAFQEFESPGSGTRQTGGISTGDGGRKQRSQREADKRSY